MKTTASITRLYRENFFHSRRGTTLSEVLISLLVMSVGVVSLATLFPISILRSVQATQLTNAANLRYNVEAMLSVVPELYTIGAPWQAGRAYSVGELVTPTQLTSLKSPPVVFQCTTAGNAGNAEPNWSFVNLGSTPDGPVVTWQTFLLHNYVIDPLGNWNVEPLYRQTPGGSFFGNQSGAPRQLNGWGGPGIRAFAGLGASNQLIAADAATLPDSWVSQAESNSVGPVTYNAGPPGTFTCTLSDIQADLSSSVPVEPTGTVPSSRIVFFDITGKVSDARPITAISALAGASQTITWPEFSGPLTITPVRARVESKEQRYTWLLSVRRGFSGASFMDVVVFFRRPFSGKDEQVYPATFISTTDPGFDGAPGISGNNDDEINGKDDLPEDKNHNGILDSGEDTNSNNILDGGGELGYPGSDDVPRNWVVVQYDTTGEKPFVKKGGFVTDADCLRWYRIIDVFESDTPANAMALAKLSGSGTIYKPDLAAFGSNTASLLLKVENSITQTGPLPAYDSNGIPLTPPVGRAMLMRGIVDVFPIRTHLTWEN